MKKSIFVLAGVAMLALASCKKNSLKDYVCECVNPTGGSGGNLDLPNATESFAQAECNDFAEYASNDGAICTLKEK